MKSRQLEAVRTAAGIRATRGRFLTALLACATCLGPICSSPAEPPDGVKANFSAGIGWSSGDFALSGGSPPVGNRYEITAPLDGRQLRWDASLQWSPLRLSLEGRSSDYEEGDMTDSDWWPDGLLFASHRTRCEGDASDVEGSLDILFLEREPVGKGHYSLEVGIGYARKELSLTARDKKYDVLVYPHALSIPSQFVTEEPGLFLEDDITTTGVRLHAGAEAQYPAGPVRVFFAARGYLYPSLDTEFREIRYRDRPAISVRRAINLSGDGWTWSLSIGLRPANPPRRFPWFAEIGYESSFMSVNGRELESSYLDTSLLSELQVDQQTVWLRTGVGF